jgi:hypothetical protein
VADRKPPSVTYALTKALRAVNTGAEHAPTVALAKRYAAAIDEDPDKLARLGRPFLAVLVELRMTPKARAGVIIGGNVDDDEETGQAGEGGAGGDGDNGGDAVRDSLDELRQRRDRRKYGAAAVDPAAP